MSLLRPRAAAIGAYAVALLVWLSLEDANSLAPALLGWIGALLIVLSPIRPGAEKDRRAWRMLPMVRGAAVGVAAALIAALLMLVKTGWHGHPVPDYPLGMIVEMLTRAPLWAGAGILAGIGVYSWRA
ncbi:MAG: hypothetical protein SGJ24_00385 [Chloroflexota bacterium]|nr:hypothetical protein [Chloroflexota bacterium]